MKKIVLMILPIILCAAILCVVLLGCTKEKQGSELSFQQTEAEPTHGNIEENLVDKETEATYGYIESPSSEDEEIDDVTVPPVTEDDIEDVQEEVPETTTNPTTVATEATESTTAPTVGTEPDVISPPSIDEGAIGDEEEA